MSAFAEGTVHTADGLRLYFRDYDARDYDARNQAAGDPDGRDRAPPARLPVICLPGLTRNHRDFAALAERLAVRRRVICPDMRGRGNSDRDADPANYNVLIETQDVLRLMDLLQVPRAAFIGSSRGGLSTMILPALRPGVVAAAVLNDVGPRIEKAGLSRIVATLSLSPASFADWDAAAASVRDANRAQFPRFGPADWQAFARCLMAEVDGRPVPDYDWKLIRTTQTAVSEEPPELWDQFALLADVPVLAIRGALSDILSSETLTEMQRRMPTLRTLSLPDCGHCPFLSEPAALAAIEALLDEADARCTPISIPSAPPPNG